MSNTERTYVGHTVRPHATQTPFPGFDDSQNTFSEPRRNPETGRLNPWVFDVQVEAIRGGFHSAAYFMHAQKIALAMPEDTTVTMQIFQREENRVVCGVDEALAILRTCAGHIIPSSDDSDRQSLFNVWRYASRPRKPRLPSGNKSLIAFRSIAREVNEIAKAAQLTDDIWDDGWDRLTVKALHDGDIVQPWEPVIEITGPYEDFAHLESVLLGVLARQTRIATNVAEVVAAAAGKPVLFFADRFDDYTCQRGDGYAAALSGATDQATPAMGETWGGKAMGTMPHALIALHGGSLTAALLAFRKSIPGTPITALVDFHNDCVAQSLEALATLGQDLYAVRLDTSGTMVDASCKKAYSTDTNYIRSPYCGVCPLLVKNVRAALDAAGGQHVKIVVSGGFTADKIEKFEAAGVPVDTYAVGSSLLGGLRADFTADLVAPCAKVGRSAHDSTRLEEVR